MADEEIDKLLARVALKDRKAFSALYAKSGAKLFGITLRILGERGEAEEALQEIFVKVWRRADRFSSGRASGLSWLSAIARNHAIDRIRARRAVSVDLDEAYHLSDPAHDPEELAVLGGEGRRIAKCMEELEPARAEAVVKAYVEGLSYDELAARYDVPLNTMRTWLRRSLMKLKECLER
ncbi:sigma-70 family RNA polymerase sigma factor [Pararhizobium haloflavum]|uniref:sigma-70 family RNA polymerase sigma factor n=1 Tax=Pararhizobium haloflavum TaxID=2037914 RepID=UPI000C1766F8|nr:sigma-70 family RNA polymerase sigma factor [Pararhizobium haloflavum]